MTTKITNKKVVTGKITTNHSGRALSRAISISQVSHTIEVKAKKIGYPFEEMFVVPTDLSTSKFQIKESKNTEYLFKNILTPIECYDQIMNLGSEWISQTTSIN